MKTHRSYLRLALVLCACMVAPAAYVRAQSETTPPPAIQAFLSAYNASDEAKLEAFARTHFDSQSLSEQPAPDVAARYMSRRKETGPLAYRGVAMSTPQHTEVLAENETGRWFQLSVEGGTDAAHYADITIDPTLSPPKTVAHPKNAAEFVHAVNAYVDQLAHAGEFSGTIIIAQNERPLLERAVGHASLEYAVPNRMDTRFNIGSIGKLFTQVAILQLMQSGTIKPGDTIGKWLPQYPNADARKATVTQLLAMRSGIGDFFGPEFMATPHGRIRSLDDYIALFAAKPLAFEPGTNQLYSNGGYIVLGLIVEKASGQSYYDYVRDHVFAPAGMTQTGYPEMDDGTAGRATGYTQTPAGLRNALYGAPARGSSAGGAYSTAPDLIRFNAALRAHRFLDARYTGWLLQRFPGTGPADGLSSSGNGVLGVAGGTPGANALLMSDSRGSAIVVLANLDPPAAEALGRQIRRWSVESARQ